MYNMFEKTWKSCVHTATHPQDIKAELRNQY